MDNPKFCFTLKVLNMELINLEISGTADFRPRWMILTFLALFATGIFLMTFDDTLVNLYSNMQQVPATIPAPPAN
jgi:hypothetical protein